MAGSERDGQNRIIEQSNRSKKRPEQAIELDAVLNALTDPIAVYDADGTIRNVSPALIEFLGFDPTDEKQEVFTDRLRMMHTDGRAVTLDELPSTRALRGEVVGGERYLFINTHGQTILAEASSIPIFTGETLIGVVSVLHDITEQQRAVEDVRESRRQVIDILESISDGFFALDNLWRFTYINGRAQQLLGLKKEDVLFKGIWDKLPNAQVLKLFKELHSAAQSKTTASFEEFIPSVDKWFEFHVYPYENGVSVYFSDITERKQADEALRKSEEQYRTLFDAIDEGFCIVEVMFDENEKPVDYRFLEINPAFEKQTGLTNALGKRAREVAPGLEEHWFETYGRIALSGRSERFINYSTPLRRWFDVYAFRVGEPQERRVAILFTDITKRKQSEEQLKESEERYRLLFENMLDGFAYCKMVFDEEGRPVDYIYLDVNPAFEALTGLKDVIGRRTTEVTPGIREAAPEMFGAFGRVSLTGRPERFEAYVDPLKMWFSISVYSTEKEHFVAVFDNITERKRTEKEHGKH